MITKKEIDLVLQRAKGLKALVIGDVMLDRYIYGTVDRISPEAPVPIVSHQQTEEKAGGAANVALNLAAWGCDTSLIGMTGNDQHSEIIVNKLEDHHIKHHLFKLDNIPTTLKTRVVASSHHLLRIDQESTAYLTGPEEQAAIRHLISYISEQKPDLIVLEDYNKGFLTLNVIKEVIRTGRNHDIFIAVDPKEKHFFEFVGVNLFKPNLREAGQASQCNLRIGDLSDLCTEWRKAMNINTIAITLGSQGIYLQNDVDDGQVNPERSIDVIDVCGAGDTVICSLALGMMSGLSLKSSGSLANLTGAYVCSHSGVVTVEVAEIHNWI